MYTNQNKVQVVKLDSTSIPEASSTGILPDRQKLQRRRWNNDTYRSKIDDILKEFGDNQPKNISFKTKKSPNKTGKSYRYTLDDVSTIIPTSPKDNPLISKKTTSVTKPLSFQMAGSTILPQKFSRNKGEYYPQNLHSWDKSVAETTDRPIPEVSRAIPEVSRAIPGVSRAIPEVSRAIPEVSRAIPEVSRAIPEVSRAIPEVSRAIPEVSRAIPEVSRAIPEVSRAIPEVSRAIPEVSRAIPGVSRTIPDSTRHIPHKTVSNNDSDSKLIRPEPISTLPTTVRTNKTGRVTGKISNYIIIDNNQVKKAPIIRRKTSSLSHNSTKPRSKLHSTPSSRKKLSLTKNTQATTNVLNPIKSNQITPTQNVSIEPQYRSVTLKYLSAYINPVLSKSST